MRLFIFSASIRPQGESHTFTLANILNRMALRIGFETELLHYGDEEHSPAQVPYHDNPIADGVPKDIQDFALAVERANIIILASPTYHGSYSSQMKNMLDCLVEDAFNGKIIIMATHGWGPSAIAPAMHLQDVARTMYGQVYPRFITASTSDLAAGNMGEKTENRGLEILTDIFKSDK